MRIHLLSDLHLEFHPFDPPAVEADVVILAGDTHLGTRGVEWARDVWGDTPVIYVMGNHEYYGEAYPRLLEEVSLATGGSAVHLLEDRAVKLGDVTFVGATLWTDFMLTEYRELAMWAAERRMSDYRKIRVSPRYRRLRPSDTAALHARSARWLREQCASLAGERLVVVTHHGPTRRSIDPRFLGDALNPAYVSDLTPLVESSGALLWVHGHIHRAFDYRCGGTRVVCNPRGYPDELDHGFDPALVIEI
jgi:Icc-related predicted phosphoesterase